MVYSWKIYSIFTQFYSSRGHSEPYSCSITHLSAVHKDPLQLVNMMFLGEEESCFSGLYYNNGTVSVNWRRLH